MFRRAAVAVVFLLAVAITVSAAPPVKLYYPNQRNADFSVEVPQSWDLEQAEEEGGFFTVTGPSGVQLSFRTIEMDEGQIDAAIEQSVQWVFDNFQDVEMGDPEDIIQNGMEGFNMTGTATNDGDDVIIVMAWLALKRTHLAEVMVVLDSNDKTGLNAAERVIKSLRKR